MRGHVDELPAYFIPNINDVSEHFFFGTFDLTVRGICSEWISKGKLSILKNCFIQ